MVTSRNLTDSSIRTKSMSFPQVFPASRSAIPASKKDDSTSAISSHRFVESPEKSDPLGLLVKMLQESLPMKHHQKWSHSWKQKVTKFGLSYSLLHRSVRGTKGTGSSSLGTPSSSDSKGTTGGSQGKSIRSDIRGLSTPQAADYKGTSGGLNRKSSLRNDIKGLATPTVHGNHNRKGMSAKSGDGIATQVSLLRTPLASDHKAGVNQSQKNILECISQTNGKLNGLRLHPIFVEWVMGYPIGWTDLKPSEMLSFQSSPTLSIN
nr:hypothetical protein [Dyadobacter diqingensis]